jgi:hypothetical protein
MSLSLIQRSPPDCGVSLIVKSRYEAALAYSGLSSQEKNVAESVKTGGICNKAKVCFSVVTGRHLLWSFAYVLQLALGWQ